MAATSSSDRLRRAFIAMASLTVLAFAVGCVALGHNYRVQRTFLGGAAPLLVAMEHLFQSSIELNAATDRLQNVTSFSAIELALAKREAALAKAREMAEMVSSLAPEHIQPGKLTPIVDDLEALIGPLVERLRIRIETQRRLAEQKRTIISTAQTGLDLVRRWGIDASLDLVDLYENIDLLSAVPSAGVNQRINRVQLLTEMKFALTSFLSGIERGTEVQSEAALEALRESLAARARNLAQLTLKLADDDHRSAMAAMLETMYDLTIAPGGLLNNQRDLLLATEDIEASRVQNQKLIEQLTVIVNHAEAAVRSSFFTQANATQRAGLIAMILLAIISASALVAVFVINSRLIERDIAKRLQHLADVTIRLAKGDVDIKVDQSGRDELGAMGRAVETFRQNALALRVANEDLRRVNDDLESFVHIASHDLKSPMRAIDLMTSWLREDIENGKMDEGEGRLNLIQSRIRRMSTLLHDLLAYARLGHSNDQMEQVNLYAMVNEIIEMLPPSDFSFHIDPAVPTILASRTPLETVIRNLIVKAVKHHDRSDGRIRVTAELKRSVVEFGVADDGPGIEPRFREKVFDVFKTLKSRDKIEGSGMGLAIVKRLVELYGGMIWIDDPDEGPGIVFRFTWPAVTHQLTDSVEPQLAA
ncbi:MAG: ATP-binding protein [Geminicoccaceae bacterium]